jgi:transcriptional regulator with XRE-family HTH domain/transcription elongation factor Elf1
MTFSEKLLLLRRQKGMSQEQLAEMLDVSRQSVSKWEAQQTLPEPSKIILISEIFEVSIDQLLKDDLSVVDQSTITIDTEDVDTAPAVVKLDVMFCTKCGKENRADSAFCGYCGNPFTSFVADKPETGELTKTDMDLAYYKANLQMQQQALQMQQQELEEARKQTEQQRQQLRLQRKQYDEMMKCPRCGSTSLSGNKKGYGVGKGVVGAIIFGPLGLVAGNIGSGKVMVTCMKCGYKFRA